MLTFLVVAQMLKAIDLEIKQSKVDLEKARSVGGLVLWG